MRKVSAIVVYNSTEKTLHNITFKHKENLIPYTNAVKEKSYNNLRELYDIVLRLAKNNNSTIPYYEEFGAKWYDIQWIDTARPIDVNKYAYVGG